MSHSSRFSFFHKDPEDGFLRHASRLRIDLLQLSSGLILKFRISGECWPEGADEGDELCEPITTESQPDTAELARSLLQQFISAKAKGGGQ